uniref:Protein TsetseEP domain-containing protein n=1 Tax=Stomoxys calcitrans TaxID=35570 RepID=A0A1I8QBA7_STOCA
MFKHNATLLLSALLLAFAANLTLANDDNHYLAVVNDFIDALDTQRRVMLCLAKSCDNLALHKLFKVEEGIEVDVRDKPDFAETHEFETEKLDTAIKTSVRNMLALEPSCMDAAYVCPTPVVVEVPKYITDYTKALDTIISLRNCVTMNDIEKVIDIIGNSVDYVEKYDSHVGNVLQRIYPAAAYVAKEFKNICAEA